MSRPKASTDAKQRMYAFLVQHNLKSCTWDGHMLVCTSSTGTLMSLLDIEHSQAVRPMWLHLEQWLKSVEASELTVFR